MSDRPSTVDQRVLLVDEQDRVIGYEDKLKAHQDGKRHRAFSVFIFRHTPLGREVLLQKRSASKYHCAGLWSNTCCSHPRPQELLLEAAQRRLQIEMGFTVPLFRAGSFLYRAELDNGMIEYEWDHIFVGTFPQSGSSIKPNPDEVADYAWKQVADLQVELEHMSAGHTPWLPEALSLALQACKLSA